MQLTREERLWLDGRAGEATRLALDLVVRMGDLRGVLGLNLLGDGGRDALDPPAPRVAGSVVELTVAGPLRYHFQPYG